MANVKSVQEQWHIRTLTYRLADALVIVAGWWLASKSVAPNINANHAIAMTIAIVLFHFVGEITGMYRNWRGVNVDKEVMCTVLTWLVAVPLIVTAMTLFSISSVEPSFLRWWLFLTLACMALSRIALRLVQGFLRARGVNTRGYAIVGVNDLACLLYTSPSPRDKRQSRMPSSA